MSGLQSAGNAEKRNGGNRSPLPVRHHRICFTALDTEVHVPLPVPFGNAHEGNVMNQRQSSLLVVDDDPHILATLPRLLAGEFEVLTAASADDAQRLFAARPIEVTGKS